MKLIMAFNDLWYLIIIHALYDFHDLRRKNLLVCIISIYTYSKIKRYDIFYCNHFDAILSFYTLNLLYAYSKTNVILEVSHKRNYCFSVVLRVFRRGIMHGHKRFCEKRHIHIILFRILSNKE